MEPRIRVGSVFAIALFIVPLLLAAGQRRGRNDAPEAPAGFDQETNGYLSQTQFEEFQEIFDENETEEDGLGPTFNDTSCGNCHNIPVSGGSGEQLETRAGRLRNGNFVEHAGGSLVHDHVITSCPANFQETVARGENSTFRSSLNILGDGFIEAIADSTITRIASEQPFGMKGLVIEVPVLEANGTPRVARFGWKNQHASLESFSADAYLNEMGITSPLQATENTANGRSIAVCDEVLDPEDNGADVRIFANFMRSTKVPPRGRISQQDDREGREVFENIGCDTCHVPTIVTAPVGTPINGGAFTVPPALGNKTIHPFSDFLLHDVGTSDPIVQNGGPRTYDMVRTPPLWGLRTRSHLMHDGQSASIGDAINRHGGQAAWVTFAFRTLSDRQRRELLVFLGSL